MNIPATFFINGTFMEINPVITREMSQFDFEIGNLFQYYVDLTTTDFLINTTFIRQGLSTNEENYNSLTGKNFAPIWHSPRYSYNQSILAYGEDAGYQFVSYNLDSLDWVGKNNRELHESFYMNNATLIERLLDKLKPGQIVIFSTGQNGSIRDEWLFDDLDLLISELVRAGYSFTTASDLLKKYRK
jgi:peptidoglycan-N-acetylmuramic acid deacetylase